MKRIETQVDLPAVPSVVWEQLMDTASMGTWNPFITSLSGVLKSGNDSRSASHPSAAGQ